MEEEDEGRVEASQGSPKIVGKSLKALKDSPMGEHGYAHTLMFWPPELWDGTFVLSHLVCDTLLQLPWETKQEHK